MTRDYLIERALANAHKTIGRAFCVALGVAHLIGMPVARAARPDDSIAECFENRIDPADLRLRKGA